MEFPLRLYCPANIGSVSLGTASQKMGWACVDLLCTGKTNAQLAKAAFLL